MNRRRWVAVGIAVGLMILSVTSSLHSRNNEEKEGSEQLSTLNSFLYGEDQLTPKVLEEGDDSQKIVKLTVDGTIMSGGSSGVFAAEGYNHESFMQQLAAIEEDESVKGILLVVNSPGGGVYESAEIARQLNQIKEERKLPLYVAMENMAASGGYYISANATKIYATEETITGSIGVIMSSMNYSGLMDKLGVKDTTVKSGALKDIGSSTRPQTEKDKEVLQSYIDSAYGRFVGIVSRGRGMSDEEVRRLADGRIYDGVQAKETGLIDALGYPEEALKDLRETEHLEKAQLIEYENATSSFARTWFGSKVAEWQGLKPSETNQLLSMFQDFGTVSAPRAMYFYGGE